MSIDAAEPPDGLSSPVTLEAWRYWQGLRGTRLMPTRRDLDPADITRILPHVMLIEVLSDPLDFRYRLIGTYVDERMRLRYTGRRAREFSDKGPGSRLWERMSRVVQERRPIASHLPYTGPDERLKNSEEIMLPLSEDGLRVTTIFDALVFSPRAADRAAEIRPIQPLIAGLGR